MEKIKPMTAGEGPAGTIHEADYANKLVAVCNAVINAQVMPAGMGEFKISKNRLTLKLAEKVLFFDIANGGALACWEICAKSVAVPS